MIVNRFPIVKEIRPAETIVMLLEPGRDRI